MYPIKIELELDENEVLALGQIMGVASKEDPETWLNVQTVLNVIVKVSAAIYKVSEGSDIEHR